MNLNRIVKIILSLGVLPLIAIAEDEKPISKKDYYFFAAKIGIDQPVTRGGNANIDNADTTYNAGVEFGKKFMEIYGLSLEYKKIGSSNLTVNNITESGFKTYSANWSGKSDLFMLNASVDVIKSSLITPYIKLGAGASVNRSSDYVVTFFDYRGANITGQEIYYGARNTKFAWQVGLGLNVTSNELFDIDMEYMFVDRGQLSTNKGYVASIGYPDGPNSSARTTNLRDHTVTIGLRAKF